MYKKIFYLSLTVIFLAGLTVMLNGCATKKFVKEGMDKQDKKITQLESSIEENQKRIKEHEAKISNLSEDTQKAFAEAATAMSEAERAQVMARGKLLYSIVLSNENLKFKVDSYDLSPEAASILDEFVSVVKSENRNVFIEIHGHTDSTGSPKYNMELGAKRAESVKRYLFEKGIPLHRLSTISYGETEPIVPNDSRENRAKNRRVVVLVLE
ncbi:MAG: hypothetical protein A2161_14800 [Candidatus Schekmanbacteria bacterium RBG_13_48_7]|uniref:OmpA-like domain-containing protein n=1 Tax=Candidatus Schekmanbacteria bacterium RBG_13_48_7 TaxID=1817878 RepID=A0A1F7RVQ3_9BACT|nr:MAG: hypothetical protein A2161_14800 [Candidatus Schekmanbacteria bacterium RBG_13_48_7]